MSEPKVSVEQASTMSLDEYISAAGIKTEKKNKKRYNSTNTSFDHMDISGLDETMPMASSQQWRLVDPLRPVGMPPLIPSTARQKFYNGKRFQYKQNNRRHNNTAGYADRDRPSNSNGTANRNRPNFKNNQRQNALYQNGLRNVLNANGLSNALVPCQSNAIVAMNQLSQSLVGLVAPLLANSTNASIDNMFETMMEKWEERRKRLPKYDMAVQQEIHACTGKPLVYTVGTSGAHPTVVSNDGLGIEGCTVTPTTTDVTMHQRFA